MARVNFTENLRRHIACPSLSAEGETVQQVLANISQDHPKLLTYVLDEQGRLRKHMMIAIDGKMINDRLTLSDKVGAASEIFILQALSGG